MIVGTCKIDDGLERGVQCFPTQHKTEADNDDHPFDGGDTADEAKCDSEEREDDIDAKITFLAGKTNALERTSH